MTYRILVIGKNGQLASALRDIFSLRHLPYEICFVGRPEVDILDFRNLEKRVEEYRPDLVINTAAYTDVENAELDSRIAIKLNVHLLEKISELSVRMGFQIIAISTDYIFDGSREIETSEDEIPNPLNFYGKTKLYGESFCSLDNTLIIRVSGLFYLKGKNFIYSILKKISLGQFCEVVSDQVTAPTYAGDLAFFIKIVIDETVHKNKKVSGIIHFRGDLVCSWYDFARCVEDTFKTVLSDKNEFSLIKPISTFDLETSVCRPKYSVLSIRKLMVEYPSVEADTLGGIQTLVKEMVVNR